MRMVLWRQRTYAHEILGTDLDDRNAGLVVEMRNDFVRHRGHEARKRTSVCAHSPIILARCSRSLGHVFGKK